MKCRGFTLTELLVATLLLALIMASGLTAWVHGQTGWRQASLEQILHERAQYVFATLEPELQMAGYFGLAKPVGPLALVDVPASAQSCGPALVEHLEQPVEVVPTYSLGCAARGSGAAPASAQLIVRRASAALASPVAGRAQWLATSTAGQLVWNSGADPVAPTGAERRDLLLRAYYVARAADGDAATPALRVKNLTSIAGAPAFIDTEVMPGVEAIQAELLPAAAPRSVRITLTLRADQADLHQQALRRITVSRQFALRNAFAD